MKSGTIELVVLASYAAVRREAMKKKLRAMNLPRAYGTKAAIKLAKLM